MNFVKYIFSYLGILMMPFFAGAQVLIVPSGSYVVQSRGALTAAGNFINDGTYTQNAGVFAFGASGDQRLDGSSSVSFNRITVGSGANATLASSGHTLSKVLLSNGTLNCNSNLVLLSNSTATALVDGLGTGDVLGTLTMQRYIDTTYGYKLISSPMSSAGVNELSDDIDLAADFPTLYSYDEGDTTYGWEIYTSMFGSLSPMYGYCANFGANKSTSETMTISGEVNNGSQSRTIYNNNEPYTQGFNLIGNPYPSPIDWNAVSGWTKTNVDNAIYFFDNSDTNQYTGVYNSYINGVSSDGVANNIIPSMQSFFVHVSDGSYPVTGTLTMTNSVRVNNFSPFYHKPPRGDSRPLVRMNAQYASSKRHDATVIYFDENADATFEKNMDAIKLMNTEKEVPNIYVISPDSKKLAINAMPVLSDSINIIPIGLKTKIDDRLIFNASHINQMPYGEHVYFADAKTGYIQDLTTKPEYQLILPAGNYDNRFSLIFSKKDITNTALAAQGLNAYYSHGNLYVNMNIITGDKGSLIIVNMAGQVIGKHELSGYGYHEIPVTFASGLYILKLVSENGQFSKKIPL